MKRPQTSRPSTRRPFAHRLWSEGLWIGALGIWWWLAATERVAAYILPHPWLVATKAADLLIDPVMRMHTVATVTRVIVALGIAMIIGMALALTAYLVPALRTAVNERLAPFLNAVPTLGWTVLGVLWFGPGNTGVVFVQVAIMLPFVFINLWEGLQTLDSNLLEMGYSFSRSRGRLVRKIALPMLSPYMLAALRLSYGVSWKISLIAEIFGTNRGLGYLLSWARAYVDSVLLLAVILIVVVLVFAGDRLLFGPLAKRQSRWQQA